MMEGNKHMKERIVSVTPRRGRGPAYIKFETIELGAFDASMIQTAASNLGAEAEFTFETTTKGDRTFQTLTSLTIVSPAAPAPPSELVPVTPLSPTRSQDPTPYVLFDRADDEAIIARIKGRALQAYVYSFKQQGTMVYGLGVDGAEACKRELARTGEIIEEESVSLIKDAPEAAYFEAKASRWALHSPTSQRIKLDTALGFKRQTKFLPGGSANPFWFEQGCSKALRNSILRLTPEDIKQRVIEAYKTSATMVSDAQEPQSKTFDRYPAVRPATSGKPSTMAESDSHSARDTATGDAEKPTADFIPDREFLLVKIRELSEAMKLPEGMKVSLWQRFIGKGLKAEDADPVALNELRAYLQHRSKTGEWPEADA